MNPLLIARNLRAEYLKLLKTAFAPRQPELAEAFRTEIEKDGFLTREPFIALAQPFENGSPLDALSPEARALFGLIAGFKNHRVRYIALDEVHTYHGTLGTDVA